MNHFGKYICLLFLLSSCACYGQSSNETIVNDHYATKNFDAVIFNANYFDALPGDRFTPSRSEIDKAEKALLTKLKDLNADRQNQYDTPVIDKNLNKYKRQYFGYINNKGNRILLINCFWRKDKEENIFWLKEKIRVLDGGSYFWNVKFNIDTDELFDLDVNGNT